MPNRYPSILLVSRSRSPDIYDRLIAASIKVMTTPPVSWTVIPPDQTASRHAEVVVAVESTVYTCDNLEHIDQVSFCSLLSIVLSHNSTQQLGSSGPFTHMAVSPNGRSLVLLTASSNLWVITSDFQRKVLEFDITTLQSESPIQIGWCGSDAVLLAYPHVVVLLGPGGETLSYPYLSTPHLVTESDGIRIVSAMECDFIQRVPESSEKVFRPGSTDPASFLFDASEAFAKRSASGTGKGAGRTDESVRAMKPDLASAVYTCIDAAGREWDVVWQRKLLNVRESLCGLTPLPPFPFTQLDVQAAKFGRAFLDLFDPREFVSMGQTLKVLNAIRYYEIGIPMTYRQYVHLPPSLSSFAH